MKNLIVYHFPCADGFCSAWIANQFLKNEDNEFLEFNYGEQNKTLDLIEKTNSDTNLYILDFSFKPEILRQLIEKSGRIILLDHHKSAEADLKEFIQEKLHIIRFNMEKSGARLTWEYFSNQVSDVPWIVLYVEDRDLWHWKLPYSQEINATLYTYKKDFLTWDILYNRGKSESGLLNIVTEGTAILRYKDELIKNLLMNAFEITLSGNKILVVNSPILQSEVAGELAKQSESKIGACYYSASYDMVRWSLRSTSDGPDVSQIAKTFSGGGHPHAAGFEIKVGDPITG